MTDQLLVTTSAAAAELAQLYDPAVFERAAARSSPPSVYPERLIFQHLCRNRSQCEGVGVLRVKGDLLMGTEGRPHRDPYAKLRADYPNCGFPELAAVS